jgi:hypothetical protein
VRSLPLGFGVRVSKVLAVQGKTELWGLNLTNKALPPNSELSYFTE